MITSGKKATTDSKTTGEIVGNRLNTPPVVPASSCESVELPSTTDDRSVSIETDVESNELHEHHDASGDSHLHAGTLQQKLMMSIAVFVPIIGTAIAIAWLWQFGFMGWTYLALMVGGWYVTGMGITIGFHRMLTHRSFEAKTWVRWLFTGAGAMAIEGSPLLWCAIHRRHHQLSDMEGDPHSPHLHDDSAMGVFRAFWHAHTGWLFREYWQPPQYKRYVPDLLNDKVVMAVDRWYFGFVLASLVAPTIIGGLITMSWTGALLGLFWGGFARILFTQHVTWSINSFCHIFGRRDFESNDQSTNNTLFGFVGHGEGWHNNHHAFPTSARHGLKWWQLDTSWIVIRMLEVTGQVWAVKTPSARAMENKSLAAGRQVGQQVELKPAPARQSEEELETDRVA